MEGNIGKMVTAYRGITKISTHPIPWPYTHLAQLFLTCWVYSLPICLVPICRSQRPDPATPMSLQLLT